MIDLLPSRTASAAAARTASSEAAARACAIAAVSAVRASSSRSRHVASSSSSGPGPSSRQHLRATPRASDPSTRSRSGRRLAVGSKGAWLTKRSPETVTPLKRSPTVALALTAASRWRDTVSPGCSRSVQDQRHCGLVWTPGREKQHVNQSPPGHPRSLAVQPPPASGRPRAQQRWPGDQSDGRDATAHLAPADGAEPLVTKRGRRAVGGKHRDQPTMLYPDEGGGQAAAGQFLRHRAHAA